MLINQLLFVISVMAVIQMNAQAVSSYTEKVLPKEWQLNTSNSRKLEELRRLFAKYDISLNATSIDLKEIDADPLTVITHKASQLPERVLVEDTSLDIEGLDIGVNLRNKFHWLTQHADLCIGKKATWTVVLAYKEGDNIYLYEGKVRGIIINPQDQKSVGFDFLPEGAEHTYSDARPEHFYPRALAIKAFIEQQPTTIRPVIDEWHGSWQDN